MCSPSNILNLKRLSYLKIFSGTASHGCAMRFTSPWRFVSGCYYGCHLVFGGKCPPIGFTCLLFRFFFLFLGLIFAPFIHFLFRKRALSKQLTQFSKEIIKYTPGTDTHDWEVVAANLNLYFYENKVWNTKYFFFLMLRTAKKHSEQLFSNHSL
ncbi:AMP_1a_G0023550.mRNA.1.CDS.1 [Saccharomyces cerevisiae]|nr:AMP_1a_G0023550.mRNA.1.CDS.1 [Saccharomyces cerevisiae]CAI6700867.1 AMP_1a_G0023550.mRNA.1.CDS.1 [Saccharomyces cerevisiae]